MIRIPVFLSALWLVVFTSMTGVGQNPGHFNRLAKTGHPRVLFLRDEEPKLLREIQTKPQLRRVHQLILEECEEILSTQPVAYQKTGRRLLSVAREGRRRIFFLAYGWRLAKDRRFLKRAEAEALAFADFPDWNPSHFLDVAETTLACAIAYDWLYHGLSKTARGKISEAIIEKGLKPSLLPEYNAWLTAKNNWNQVCNAGMALGALAVIGEVPVLAELILSRSVSSAAFAVSEYGTDGAYPEGYGYWEYGTTFQVMMISALEKVNGPAMRLSDGFLNTGTYMLNIAGAEGTGFNYSDNYERSTLHPAMFWFASRKNDSSLLWHEMKTLNREQNLHRVRELPLLLVWGKDLDLTKLEHPPYRLWVSADRNAVATIRTGWDDKAMFLGIKAGSPAFNHGHMDVGSFVLDADGERWAIDPGPQDYHSLESAGLGIWSSSQHSDRWRVFRYTNFAHNTLVIDGDLQIADGISPITRKWNEEQSMGVTVDLTPVYASGARSAFRHAAILNSGYAVITDEVRLKSKGIIRWNLVTRATVIVHDKTWIELSQNGKRMFIRIVGPHEAKILTGPLPTPAPYDASNDDLRLLKFEFEGDRDDEIRFTAVFSSNQSLRYLPAEEIEVLIKSSIP